MAFYPFGRVPQFHHDVSHPGFSFIAILSRPLTIDQGHKIAIEVLVGIEFRQVGRQEDKLDRHLLIDQLLHRPFLFCAQSPQLAHFMAALPSFHNRFQSFVLLALTPILNWCGDTLPPPPRSPQTHGHSFTSEALSCAVPSVGSD